MAIADFLSGDFFFPDFFTGLPPVGTTGDGRQFRFLQDAFVNGYFLQAGTVATDLDLLPAKWVPIADVEPLNAAGAAAYFAAGVQLPGLIRQVFQTNPVPKPVTFWTPKFNLGQNVYGLTGLGAGLGTAIGPPPGTFN